MLPIMLSAMKDFPEHQFVIGAAPSQDAEFYRDLLGNKQVKVVSGQTYELMQFAEAGLITSGTATLEAALWGLPEVICYKGSFISYWIARMLVKIKFIGLVNLVMDREVIVELIQADLNRKNLVRELNRLLYDEERKAELKRDYKLLWKELGGSGASARVAKGIYSVFTSNTEQ
jgi:lipid-A-disaccharide synthase